MADADDVLNALSSLIGSILYPSGVPSGTNPVSPIIGVPVRVAPGWPIADDLQADLASGISYVTIFPRPEEKNITTMDMGWFVQSQPTPTLTVSVSNNTVTIGGTVTPGEAIGIKVGNTSYPYLVQTGDTLSTIAASLSALIPGSASNGAVLVVPAFAPVSARIGVPTVMAQEVKRQEKTFQIVIWSNSPLMRGKLASAIDSVLGSTYRLLMGDGTNGMLEYVKTVYDDMLQKETLWRRDLFYKIIYSTIRTQTVMQTVGVNITPSYQQAPIGG